MPSYTSIFCLSCVALLTLTVLVRENGRLDPSAKRRFYQTYLVLAVASFAEWLGLILNGGPDWTRGLLAVAKCCDYSITPVTGIFFVRQVADRSLADKYLRIALLANVFLQVASVFTGWTFYLDENNCYHHGSWYALYILLYCVAILTAIYQFVQYGKRFKKQHILSLVCIFLLIIFGIVLQEVFGLRVFYLAIVLDSLLLFIHYSEYSQMASDDSFSQQKKLLETDVLTGLFNRYAYSEALRTYEELPALPDDLAVFSIDINSLKMTNDTLGHAAGDELIIGASSCILGILGPHGRCFRTSGDEFICLVQADREQADLLKAELVTASRMWHGTVVSEVNFAIGIAVAVEHPETPIQKLIIFADEEMYREKDLYYQQSGKKRRNYWEDSPEEQ